MTGAMCGILGEVTARGEAVRLTDEQAERWLGELDHRGPDGRVPLRVARAHRRQVRGGERHARRQAGHRRRKGAPELQHGNHECPSKVHATFDTRHDT